MLTMLCECYPTASLSETSSFFQGNQAWWSITLLHFIGIFMFLASFVGVLHEITAKQIGWRYDELNVSLMTSLSSKHHKNRKGTVIWVESIQCNGKFYIDIKKGGSSCGMIKKICSLSIWTSVSYWLCGSAALTPGRTRNLSAVESSWKKSLQTAIRVE